MSHLKRKPRQGQMDASKEWIADAYLDLLLKAEDAEKVSLSRIASRAGVSRQTLYRHFTGKEDVLDWYQEKQFAAFWSKSQQFAQQPEYHQQNIQLVFQFCRENIDFLRILIKLKQELLFLRKLEEFTSRISDVIMHTDDNTEKYYREKIFAGALFMSIMGWVELGGGNPPDFLPDMLITWND